MIINIPLQVDEQQMEEVIKRDYEGKVIDRIVDYIKTTLAGKSNMYYGGPKDRMYDGMTVLIEAQIKSFLNDHTEEIIDVASKILADKLARSKKGKAIIDGLGEQDG